jgi:hypothetical protein
MAGVWGGVGAWETRQQSLNDLVAKLTACHCYVVRCVKPNAAKEAGRLDLPLVTAQLWALGLVETVRVRQRGFPLRLSFRDFCVRYKCLQPTISMAPEHAQASVRTLLAIAGPDTSDVQMGKTRIFLRAAAEAKLERVVRLMLRCRRVPSHTTIHTSTHALTLFLCVLTDSERSVLPRTRRCSSGRCTSGSSGAASSARCRRPAAPCSPSRRPCACSWPSGPCRPSRTRLPSYARLFLLHSCTKRATTHPYRTYPCGLPGVTNLSPTPQVQKRRAFPLAMSSEQRRRQYDALDRDGKGHVTVDDLVAAIQAAGLREHDGRLGGMIEALQRGKSHRLDYNVCASVCSPAHLSPPLSLCRAGVRARHGAPLWQARADSGTSCL